MANPSNPLPPVFRFDFGDYTSLGSVFQKFLANLNLFTLAVYNLLNKGIGFQNLQRSIYTTSVLASSTTPLSFVNPLTVPPSGLCLVQVLLEGKTQTTLTSSISVANWVFDGRNINILNIAGLTSGKNYQISVEVM